MEGFSGRSTAAQCVPLPRSCCETYWTCTKASCMSETPRRPPGKSPLAFLKRGHEDLLRTQLVYICRGLLPSRPLPVHVHCALQEYGPRDLQVPPWNEYARGVLEDLEGFHTDLQVRRRTLLSTRVGNTYISYSLTLSDSLSSSFCFIGSSSLARPRGNMPVRTF